MIIVARVLSRVLWSRVGWLRCADLDNEMAELEKELTNRQKSEGAAARSRADRRAFPSPRRYRVRIRPTPPTHWRRRRAQAE
jgi:hypothetical protein